MTVFEQQVVDKLVKDYNVPQAEAARAVAHARTFTDPASTDYAKGVDHVTKLIVEKGGLTPLTNDQVALENSLNALTGDATAVKGQTHPDADDRRITTDNDQE